MSVGLETTSTDLLAETFGYATDVAETIISLSPATPLFAVTVNSLPLAEELSTDSLPETIVHLTDVSAPFSALFTVALNVTEFFPAPVAPLFITVLSAVIAILTTDGSNGST